ncbi:MAG: carboxylating nicotinate-nucleotide diphosphorylase [Kiritimatiellae bacterium]|nr:carboxylating nicotinate-nucleotide diphosphorylase [Kiritimatiellia bacterium]
MNITDDNVVKDIIQRALDEDIGAGDVTTNSLVPEDAMITAYLLARTACIVSGTDVAHAVFKALDNDISCTVYVSDAEHAKPGDTIMCIKGKARAILTAERTALNFMQRMTGIATLTGEFVEKARKHEVKILDTRKTTPTIRVLEKYAVLCGGGENHRIGLFDRVLIKDNHRKLWRSHDSSRLDEAINESRAKYPGITVEVEVETEDELISALGAEPEWILLDNMSPDKLRRCVEICDGMSRIEASGGITLDNIDAVVNSGVDAVSLGCLTHSAPAADLSLEIKEKD